MTDEETDEAPVPPGPLEELGYALDRCGLTPLGLFGVLQGVRDADRANERDRSRQHTADLIHVVQMLTHEEENGSLYAAVADGVGKIATALIERMPKATPEGEVEAPSWLDSFDPAGVAPPWTVARLTRDSDDNAILGILLTRTDGLSLTMAMDGTWARGRTEGATTILFEEHGPGTPAEVMARADAAHPLKEPAYDWRDHFDYNDLVDTWFAVKDERDRPFGRVRDLTLRRVDGVELRLYSAGWEGTNGDATRMLPAMDASEATVAIAVFWPLPPLRFGSWKGDDAAISRQGVRGTVGAMVQVTPTAVGFVVGFAGMSNECAQALAALGYSVYREDLCDDVDAVLRRFYEVELNVPLDMRLGAWLAINQSTTDMARFSRDGWSLKVERVGGAFRADTSIGTARILRPALDRINGSHGWAEAEDLCRVIDGTLAGLGYVLE